MKFNDYIVIEGKTIVSRGICIGSDVVHTGKFPDEGCLIFLFTTISNYAKALEEATRILLAYRTALRMQFDWRRKRERQGIETAMLS